MTLIGAVLWWRSSHPNRCFYCGEWLKRGRNKSIDHVQPKSKVPELASKLYNRVPCCKPCNRIKGTLSVDEFRHLRYSGKDTEFYGETLYRVHREKS